MSNDDETVERVARAIYEGRYAKDGGVWAYVETKDVWYAMARAALSAMPQRDELLRELLAEALEALTPFASDADLWSGSDSLSLVEAAPGYSDALNVGDLRRARATADKIWAVLRETEE